MGGGSSDDRRLKAALFLLVCLAAGLLPHALGPLARLIPSLALATLLGAYAVRTVFLRPAPPEGVTAGNPGVMAAAAAVDVVVAARDEEAVIERLVERVLRLRWPAGLLRLWVIDDGSEDRTPQLLAQLQKQHAGLRVLRRSRDAGGGKSAALNLVLEQLQGRWMLVLDADADLAPDLLERLIPFAEQGGWAAVQLRKAEVNAGVNWLTRAQAMEMALDATIQEGRLARGGVAELRGNGQLLRRDAVHSAG
ncbi:MAG: glycosyltransferase family 2 protein, partial [Cyanobacteriota bacterium]|nr:glycosyltransferase family 2 protein [Cyanobacteriota bacterium]